MCNPRSHHNCVVAATVPEAGSVDCHSEARLFSPPRDTVSNIVFLQPVFPALLKGMWLSCRILWFSKVNGKAT